MVSSKLRELVGTLPVASALPVTWTTFAHHTIGT